MENDRKVFNNVNYIKMKYFKREDWTCLQELIDLSERIFYDFESIDKNIENEIIIFGAGSAGQKLYQLYNKNNITVRYFCDNDKSKHNIKIDGVSVISPEQLVQLSHPFIIIASTYWLEIEKQVIELGLPYSIIDIDQGFGEKLNDIKENLEKLYEVYSLLNDDRSRFVFLTRLKAIIINAEEYLNLVSEGNEYWALPQFVNNPNEIFVDAGAFNGDTVDSFLYNNGGNFKKIYAFEPNHEQFENLRNKTNYFMRCSKLPLSSIECIQAGVGERDETLSFYKNEGVPAGSTFYKDFTKFSSCNMIENIRIYALDSYLKDIPITLLKADVEGFELAMLKGAQDIICKERPRLAIAIYHKQEDLWEIPLFIKKLVPEYKMAIRHHGTIHYWFETVLYCWI
ncbi:FkbM family methyltransferase [Pelosinus propionicus]|uniref:Methyltransferase, FkbM family n=1 Tax=Pelosinus propionicus DSM 13327 TaxID=1123291 RepID=A0A1I4HTY1_9FIRM|nr:FkbM family methyltransferase [Pelosinus propionicus]SFL45223.1 methyltransferase, FkbM family [Pelosinus propionicus DSM 13327]